MTIEALNNEGTVPTIASGDAEIHLRQNVDPAGPLQFVRVDNNFELLRLKVNESALVINSNETDIGTNTTAIALNTAKDTNATHTGEVTGATALTIADDTVDEANLKVDVTPTDDYVLTAKSSAAGGLTWAAAAGGGGGQAFSFFVS